MIALTNSQIEIDGQPTLILSGEIHYFRLPVSEWADRIQQLKAAGCTTVTSYIPWLCHEEQKGVLDFSGNLDVQAFVRLCQSYDLSVIIKPGPFIMAEMKNEGIPYWVYAEIPEAVPVGWDNQRATTPTLDYLNRDFLALAKKWYQSVAAVLIPCLHQNGGNIIAMQLDNEIGMLSWVSNVPELTADMIDGLKQWLKTKYTPAVLRARYPLDEWQTADHNWIRSPKDTYAAALRLDLGYYSRQRYRNYVKQLRAYALTAGFTGIPFIVNIHGTGGGRGERFPIGISQLFEAYQQSADIMPASDIYYGDLTMEVFQDLYLGNACMQATTKGSQPVGSIEFNCGDGNFGDNYGGRYDVSAVDLKARLCLAQAHRLLNYYLFAGGINPEMKVVREDGNDRIASTGKYHGFAAPIDPYGNKNYTFDRMAESIQTFQANRQHLAQLTEETDQLRFGFIPDYFMTQYSYPKSEKMGAITQHLERFRGQNAWEILGRSLLLANFRFQALDIQQQTLDLDPSIVLVLVFTKYLNQQVQEKIAAFLKQGGKALIYGLCPQYDDQGDACTILADALGVTIGTHHEATSAIALSVVCENLQATKTEWRTGYVQTFHLMKGKILLREKMTKEVCGALLPVGTGRALLLTTDCPGDRLLFKEWLQLLAVSPKLTHTASDHGLLLQSTVADNGRLIHLLNLDGHQKKFQLFDEGRLLFSGHEIVLDARRGLMLPLHYTIDAGTIRYATGELCHQDANRLQFRCFAEGFAMDICTNREILPTKELSIVREGNQYTISGTPRNGLVEILLEA